MEHTIDELLPKVNKKFNETYTRLQLQKYLVRNKIKYKYSTPGRVRDMSKASGISIGTEYKKSDGMTLLKVGRNKWMYKQRYIYEQWYGVKLKSDEYVIFLNQDRNDFSIDNLKVISRKTSGYLANHNLYSSDRNKTKLGIREAESIYKGGN